MTWLLRAAEAEDGQWECSEEWVEPETHDNLCDAVVHPRAVARSLGCAELLVSSLNGDVERLGWAHPANTATRIEPVPVPVPRSASDTQNKIDALMA